MQEEFGDEVVGSKNAGNEYDYLRFYKQSGDNNAAAIRKSKGKSSKNDDDDFDDDDDEDGGRGALEKHAEVLEYLKSVRREGDVRVSFIDIERHLQINLNDDDATLDMIKNNPKIDVEYGGEDGEITLQYRGKYEIRDRAQLLETINRVKSGVLISDIQDCYNGITDHCADLVLSGGVIEYKNTEKKTGVLYPRGSPFLTSLPGTVCLEPGRNVATTSVDLQTDIRRGDSVNIGHAWFRVSCYTGVGDDRWNKFRSSVSSDDDFQSSRGFREEFTASKLPLDADYDGVHRFEGPARKHGCTNDIRLLWQRAGTDMRKVGMDEDMLVAELLKNKLINRPMSTMAKKRNVKEVVKKIRKKTVRTSSSNRNGNNVQNLHLRGSNIERIAEELYQQSMHDDNAD